MKRRLSSNLFYIFSYFYIGVLTLFCLLPFMLLVSASFTAEGAIYRDGYRLWPSEISLEAYRVALGSSVTVLKAYQVSIGVTVGGTALGLFIMMMAAYVLQRKDFRFRNRISFFFYFTTLFNGGLVAYYMMIVRYLDLKNNYLAILLPGLMSPWLILLLRSYMTTIPHSLTESAKIDGANDLVILFRIIAPLAKPGLATIGLFLALQYWNDWFNASMFLNRKAMFPLQYYLQNVIMNAEFARELSSKGANSVTLDTPTESLKMATSVIATGPIVLVYPWVQKYFVKGLTIGAVKG